MKHARYLVPMGILLVLLYFLWTGLRLNPKEVPSPLIGKLAPAFSLPLLDQPEQRISRDTLRGQVWILNVWASWCMACRQEHPLLVQFAKQGKVPIYGLNYKDERTAGMQWLADFGNPYTASMSDRDGRVGIDFGVYGVPETFVIDREGIIRYKQIGPLTPEVLRDTIEPLLQQLDS